jgi:peptidyl-prolyl cis-trans isomerase A (cyclophilin A)
MRDKAITIISVIIVLGFLAGLNHYLRPGEKPIRNIKGDFVEWTKTESQSESRDLQPEEKRPMPNTVRDFMEEANAQPQSESRLAVIETNMGTFTFKFYAEDAPGTTRSFIELAEKGFYDGTIFHRVIAGFMIQGGDPEGTGMGGPGYRIKAEFNERKHLAGTVAMARTAKPDSAGSQFYVCLEPTPHLDGKYTVFGQVVDGLDVVQAIGKVSTDRGDRPLDEVVMKKVTIREASPAKE